MTPPPTYATRPNEKYCEWARGRDIYREVHVYLRRDPNRRISKGTRNFVVTGVGENSGSRGDGEY